VVRGVKKLPVLYIYRRTNDAGQELRYSLRSLKNIKNFNGKVFVAGDTEDWFTNITHIPIKASHYSPYKDAENRMVAALNDQRLPDDFIFMNDDFYVTEPAVVRDMNWGEISDDQPRSFHRKALLHTKKWLQERNLPTLNYGLHVPMIINRQRRFDVHQKIKTTVDNRPLLARTVYGNMFNLGGEFYEDRKTKTSTLPEGAFISTQGFTAELHKLFPDPSPYEGEFSLPIVHMIWLGSEMPERYKRNKQTFEKAGYRVKVWTEPMPGMVNRDIYDRMTTWAGKSDVMRLEILLKYGGLYTDTDSYLVSRFPTDRNLVVMTSSSGFIANETIYATKDHPAIREAVEGLRKHVERLPSRVFIWDIAGAKYLTPIFKKYSHIKLTRSQVGRQRTSKSVIIHQYDGSWVAGGTRKAQIMDKGHWIGE
jgi:hypothetical protein